MKNKREFTRKIRIGALTIGGGSSIAIQSMCNSDTRDVKATVRQIKALQEVGCEIVRVGVLDMEAAQALGSIKRQIKIPLVADIHFDHQLALEAIRQGVDKLRLNPGNISDKTKVEAVVKAAKERRIPIRIGVNAGSLKAVRAAHTATAKASALVKGALSHIQILESLNFNDIVISLKASDVETTTLAYKLMATKRNYPLHLGITEAGSIFRGTVKSSVGLGIMLAQGLGDTLRVSLTADPVEEVAVAYQILQALNLRSTGTEVISCPTCARTEVDLIGIVNKLENELSKIQNLTKSAFAKKPLKIAVMGCVVNGPGEAAEADFGIAGGKGVGLLFEGGKVTGKVPPSKWVSTLISMVHKKIKG
jgi:(E)-4-hydroxy-3-methylbut-2-enyl-diphosphate synthase